MPGKDDCQTFAGDNVDTLPLADICQAPVGDSLSPMSPEIPPAKSRAKYQRKPEPPAEQMVPVSLLHVTFFFCMYMYATLKMHGQSIACLYMLTHQEIDIYIQCEIMPSN